MQASAAVQVNAPVREDNAEQQLVEGEQCKQAMRAQDIPVPDTEESAEDTERPWPTGMWRFEWMRPGEPRTEEEAVQAFRQKEQRRKDWFEHCEKKERERVAKRKTDAETMRDTELKGVEEAFNVWPLAGEEFDDERFDRIYPEGWNSKEEREVHGKYLGLWRDQERKERGNVPAFPET